MWLLATVIDTNRIQKTLQQWEEGYLFVFLPCQAKFPQPMSCPSFFQVLRLTLTEASPGTSGENRAECRDTKSLSSWSKLHSIRFVSHDRIPVEEKEDSWQASREASLRESGEHPYKGFSGLFLEVPARRHTGRENWPRGWGSALCKMEVRGRQRLERKELSGKWQAGGKREWAEDASSG